MIKITDKMNFTLAILLCICIPMQIYNSELIEVIANDWTDVGNELKSVVKKIKQ